MCTRAGVLFNRSRPTRSRGPRQGATSGSAPCAQAPPRSRGRRQRQRAYERSFSFLPRNRAPRATPATLTILKRTPGMSPTAWPFRPKPATSTSSCGRAVSVSGCMGQVSTQSGGDCWLRGGRRHTQAAPCLRGAMRRCWALVRTFSSMKFKQPSLGTKQAIFLPFLISCTRTHFRMAEFGCLASMPLWRGARVSTRGEAQSPAFRVESPFAAVAGSRRVALKP